MSLNRLSLILSCLVVLLFSCNRNNSNSINESPSTSTYQYENKPAYEEEWQEIEKLEKKGLGKTIIEKADAILEKALAEDNFPQVFKAMTYRSKYENQIEEESTLKILNHFETRITAAEFPLKQLLHSAIAELYHQYYNQNRWRFIQRTNTTHFDPKDLRSWSLHQISAKVNEHYLASLSKKEELQQLPVQILNPVLNYRETTDKQHLYNGNTMRPSIFDFLAHRALGHFKRNEGKITQPIHSFSVDSFPVFSPIQEYVSIPFMSKDSSSNIFYSALLFQELLTAHAKDKQEHVLIYNNLERLQFFYNESNNDLKDSLYLDALKALSSKYASSEMIAEIDYKIAQLYFQWGSKYINKKELIDYKDYLKKARSICTQHAHKNSLGGKSCKDLLQQIEASSFSFINEKNYLPKDSILFRLNYKNIDSIFFRIVQLPHELDNISSYQNRDGFIRSLLEKRKVREWGQEISNSGDFQQQSTEINTGGLTKGRYALMASLDNKFDTESPIATGIFNVSGLAYISQKTAEGSELEIYVLNRASGEAIENAAVHIYKNRYDYNNRQNSLIKEAEYHTNNLGYVKLKSKGENNNFQLKVTFKDDTLNAQQTYYIHNYRNGDRSYTQTHLFTDRAIYRPGQTVYFKGIVIEKRKNKNTLKQQYSSTISLYNVNGEELKTLSLSTNDYGSYQGSFTLPSSGLNGNYRIQDKHGSVYFSVEEYKRPSFKIDIDTSSGQQRINSSITITGNTETYSGAKLSNTTINYRVVRKASYRNWSYLRSFIPPANQKEIANGSTITDLNGKFQLSFFAQADETVNTAWNPFFNYEIIIDAISPTGETQSLSHYIQLSKQGVYLSANIDEAIQLEELKQLIITAKNASNQLIDTKAQLKLWKLETPKDVVKPSLWSSVDHYSLDRKEYKKLFPDYPLAKEKEIDMYPRELLLTSGMISCNQKVKLFRTIKPGAYELDISTINNNGDTITFKKRFVLFEKQSSSPPFPVFVWMEPLKTTAEPGETIEFIVSSSLPKLRLLYEVVHQNNTVSSKIITLSKEQRKISIPVKEAFRGNFSFHLTGVHSNRIIQLNQLVQVPFTDKKLKLELGTFRNKVEPNSKEKWTLSVSGMEGEKVTAELLAGMYDQSLDQFATKSWDLSLYHSTHSSRRWQADAGFQANSSQLHFYQDGPFITPYRVFPELNWFGFYLGNGGRYYRTFDKVMPMVAESVNVQADDNAAVMGNVTTGQMKEENLEESEETLSNNSNGTFNPIRSDFRESVFFYPQLRTDQNGKVSFEFSMPEALTQWKFRAIAHTKDLKVGSLEESIQTQKKLMVTPNVPRFFRSGDLLQFKVLIQNSGDELQNGTVQVQFFDAFTSRIIDISSGSSAAQPFELESGKSIVKQWQIKIPEGTQAIMYRVQAKSDIYSDGEEKVIPVLSNRMLVTESLPLAVRGNQYKDFSFEKLYNNKSSSLRHESFTVEFASNPAWYAIQALPYLVSTGNECSEQVFSRLYANSIAELIVNSQPNIKKVFDNWKLLNSQELSSKLMQNQELKSILIEESPWLRKAKNESEQKQMIALLFDYNRMAKEKGNAIEKLQQLQLPNGGWAWYKGMRDNRYITQYIINGLGHLKKMGVDLGADQQLSAMLEKGIAYLDARIEEDYDKLLEHKVDLNKNHLSYLQAHYLYTRSFFTNHSIPQKNRGYSYYLKQASKYWLNQSLYIKSMIALSLNRLEPNSTVPETIIKSLKDHAIQSEALGMYWKNNQAGYYWYNAPVETQAILIELFKEVAKDDKSVEEMRIWLLKQKQTQSWSNSKATALACYALLIDNTKALRTNVQTVIKVGGQPIKAQTTEAGTGYFKKKWEAGSIDPSMANINVEKASDGIAWGAAYWQYYEDMDKITHASTDELNISKELFKVIITDEGEKMIPINTMNLKVGDKVRVRIRIESKRNMEFVHLKDMRASGFEPLSVISGYKFQDGLGYYESIKDASANFFIDWMRKGVYVFEYDLRASISGEYSNGISSIQCQYAPEFTSHSEGRAVVIQ